MTVEIFPKNEEPAPDQDTWISTLSEEYRELPTFTKFKSANDLAKSYMNLEKMLGGDKLSIPKDPNDEAAWAPVYSRLGRPESADKYDVKINLPEQLNVPKETFDALKTRAYSLGMSTKQLQGIVDHWSEIEGTAYAQRIEANKKAELDTETGLRRKLGANYEVAKTNVLALVKNFAPAEARESILEELRVNPTMFEFYHNLSKSFSEDTLKGSRTEIGMTPEEAEAEYKKMLADFSGPLHKELHPEHDIAVKRVEQLLKYIDAGKSRQPNAA